jgi:NitT/TauT family transport system permease protein
MSRSLAQVILLTILLIGIILFVPNNPEQKIKTAIPFAVVVFLLGVLSVSCIFRSPSHVEQIRDLFSLIWIILFLWEIFLSKIDMFDPFLFPAPERVFVVFAQDYEIMIRGIVQSLSFILAGYSLALITAIPSGLIIGWKKRVYNLTYPVAKALSPVPPTVYLPYAIVLLPTFYASSIFVIFISAFWPILVGTVYGVHNIDRRIINSARTLGLSDSQMITKILFPASLPNIFSGALIALILSFVILTIAEMIGASSGLGWYIQYHSQFANYAQVIAGMILIVIVVIGVMKIFESIQAHLLRWQQIGR